MGSKAPGGIGVLVDLIGVRHGHTGGGDPLIGPDRLQDPLIRVQPPLLERRGLEPHPLRQVAGHQLHGHQADVLLVTGVDGPIESRILLQPRIHGDHDHVHQAPLGGDLELLGPALVMGREPDEPHLAGLLDGGDRLFHLLALGPVHLVAGQPVVDRFS